MEIMPGIEVVADDDPTVKARRLVQHQYNVHGIGTPRGQKVDRLLLEEIKVVWFNYTLGNWKALITTIRSDNRYYEVTHNDLTKETYIDTYLKTHNTVYTEDWSM